MERCVSRFSSDAAIRSDRERGPGSPADLSQLDGTLAPARSFVATVAAGAGVIAGLVSRRRPLPARAKGFPSEGATLARDPLGEVWSEDDRDDRGPRHSKSPWNGIPGALA